MAQFYLRRLDIINRGFGGRSSRKVTADFRLQLRMVRTGRDLAHVRAIPVFETIFPKKEQRERGCAQSVPLMTIWFGTSSHVLKLTSGANDSVLPGKTQHVPLDRYKSNLAKIIHFVKNPSSPWYSPETRIVLITAPPIIPQEWLKYCEGMWRQNGSNGPKPTEIDREPANTKKYVEACLEVAKEQGVEVVDAWKAIVDQAGGSDAGSLAPYF
jgi:hypothetical protein